MNKFDNFFAGEELEAYKLFGSFKEGNGVRFTVFAPKAVRIQVFGSYANWEEFTDLEKIDDRGVWSGFVDNIELIHAYKYRLWKDNYTFHDRIDPYAHAFEARPGTASCMYDLSTFKFNDKKFMDAQKGTYDTPLNIYEVHANGFKKEDGQVYTSYRDLKDNLIPYVKEMGYSHIELMPLFEYPFDGSWGYQATGFYGITSRYGSPIELMEFINEAHKNGIGVIMDAAYTGFAADDYALANYDFSHVYEYKDAKGSKTEWGTYYFDLGYGPVISFLMSSANFFASELHFDGIRFDAVSLFVYRDGNSNIGENQEGIAFVKRINFNLKQLHPGLLLIAEDSTAFPYVTKPVEYGGLGFDYKWDLGWMNDTLTYYKTDPIYRKYDHNKLTFSMAYFYNDRFLLPFSHDEVVHGKATLVQKMWGADYDDKFRQCRNLFAYMYGHPGKKLNFMGNEIAMFREFDENKQIDWFMTDYPAHDSFQRYIRDLNNVYNAYPAFSCYDYDPLNFKWIDADNNEQSVYSFVREQGDYAFVCVFNMLNKSYEEFKLGVPYKGLYTEVINSEQDIYSGCNMCNFKPVKAVKEEFLNQPYSLTFRLAPFGAIFFKVKKEILHKESKNTKKAAKAKVAVDKAVVEKDVKHEAKKVEAKNKKVKKDLANDVKKIEKKETIVKKDINKKVATKKANIKASVEKETKKIEAKKAAVKKDIDKKVKEVETKNKATKKEVTDKIIKAKVDNKKAQVKGKATLKVVEAEAKIKKAKATKELAKKVVSKKIAKKAK